MSIVADELQKFLPAPFGVEASAFYSFVMLLMVSVGVMLLVHTGLAKSKYNIEEYNKEHDPLYRERLTPEQLRMLDEESHMPLAAKWSACIMIVTTAVYLLWSFFTECLAGELGPIPGRRPVLRNRLYCAGTEKIEKMEEDTHESCNCDTEEGGGDVP